jgi:hypothetical protein
LLIPAILTAVVLQSQSTPKIYPSPRLAAIAFAVANGFEIPRANLIVANEVETGMTNDVPRTANDRARSLPVEVTLRDSQAVARFLGLDVKTAPVSEIRECPQRLCFNPTKSWVLLVDELKNDGTGVYIKLYAPMTEAGGRGVLFHAIVDTARSGSGWVATKFTFGPKNPG